MTDRCEAIVMVALTACVVALAFGLVAAITYMAVT